MQAPGPPPPGGGPLPPPPPPPPPAPKPAAPAAAAGNPLADDLAALAAPDVGRPFASVADAVARLMPYHLLAQDTAEVTDATQLEASTSGSGPRLLLGRGAALEEVGVLSVRAVADGVARSAAAATALTAALDAGVLGLAPPPGTEGDPRPEEAWLVARLAAEAEAAALAEARAAAARAGVVVVPPAPAAPPPPASLHAAPPLRGVGGTAYPAYAATGAPPPPPRTAYER